MYVNNLRQIKPDKMPVGCYINNVFLNHLMLADYVMFIAPSMKGLYKLIDQCLLLFHHNHYSFQCHKNVCMVCCKQGRRAASEMSTCSYLGSERISDQCT